MLKTTMFDLHDLKTISARNVLRGSSARRRCPRSSPGHASSQSLLNQTSPDKTVQASGTNHSREHLPVITKAVALVFFMFRLRECTLRVWHILGRHTVVT